MTETKTIILDDNITRFEGKLFLITQFRVAIEIPPTGSFVHHKRMRDNLYADLSKSRVEKLHVPYLRHSIG